MILIDDKTIVTFRNNKAGKEGGAVYANQSTICTNGSSRVTFTNNDGDWHGYGGALSAINSDIFFHGNSAVTFNNNRANCGGAVYILYNVTMSFGENCTVTFTGNHAIDDFHGGAVFAVKSHITFHGYSKVIFSNNHAGSGGAIMLWDNSVITFNENSNITFLGNNAKHYAGAVFVRSKSVMSFNETSTVSFTKNAGQYGGSVFTDQCNIIFNGYSTVTFSRNYAMNGGVITMRSTMQPISFKEHCTVLFNNNRATDQGGALFSLLGSAGSVEFTGNSSVMFYNNRAETGGAVSANTVYQGNANVTFVHNRARYGGAIYISKTSYTTFTGNAIVDFCNNTASLNGGAISSLNNSNIWFTGRSTIYFNNNLARQHGGAISSVVNTRIAFDETCSVRFAGNKVTQQGGAIYLFDNSTITFKSTSDVTYNNNSTALQQDGTVFSALQSNTLFKGNSKNVTFVHNRARYGGAIYISKTSYTTFTGKSIVDFCNNTASLNGGAISSLDNSNIWFTGRSTIYFNNNLARQHGGAISSVINTRITFDETCSVRFAGNKVTQQGGAIYLFDKSTITFKSTSDVTYNNNNNNTALQQNGTVFSTLRSNTLFKGNSKNVTFVHNRARYGGAIYISKTSYTSFTGKAIVDFCNNTASLSGGAISSLDNSNIWFTGGPAIYFNNNLARQHGGAISSVINTRITFDETCSVRFAGNTVMQQGGAIYLFDRSTIVFGGNSDVTYNNNTALQQGGAVYSVLQSNALFKGNSAITFKSNKAVLSGGALYSFSNNPFHFEDSCTILFYHNMVRQDGGAIQTVNSTLYFGGSSSVTFTNNTAMQQGGALNLFNKAAVMFLDNCNVNFTNNKAMQHGGAVYVHDDASVDFAEKSEVIFYHNMAESDGGALYSYSHCNITIRQHSELMFVRNSAMQYGGAMYCDGHSDVRLEGNNPVTFTSNSAEHGGAVYVSQSFVKFANNSVVIFNNNRAIGNGGAIYLTDRLTVTFDHGSSIRFVHNTANRYGGALYSDVQHGGLSKIILNTTGINLTSNRALIGNSVYFDIPTSCDEACLNNSIIGIDREVLKYGPLVNHIYTPPSKLILGDPAVCIDIENVTDSGTYYVNNIMLGQEIILEACVRDYYDQPAVETQFIVNSNDKDHTINESNSVLISCNWLQGIYVTGSKVSDVTNFTMTLISHAGSQSDLKTISIELITELSPCHPGFYYDDTTQRCSCYHYDDTITCSDSTSLIRRGYWFGVVNDKSTVTVCPNNYCNFTCCEATNGFYKLSPMRINQCSSHRSGTACGSCEEGYTLSFDSVECVSVDKCTTGQTALVVTLSVIYWIVIVILVFIMTYYHVGIGYLYAITYYYSMLDILLSQTLYQSKELFTTVATLSSLVKITPQFLGQFCLVENMSGIDQQFIHYAHPLAVTIILALICQSAKLSHKFSSFISRGIIRTVCFLLLLSYTSVATTSLLLLRSLTFDNVDKVYTYLSPDIEYCHGRHLPYFIVAVLCTLVIVIGLPLLLLLEPFLNQKINFTRMKPLLDQFQGSYKDKYRSFAAYYMICRLVIIVIIIAIPSSNDLSQFLLIFSNVVLAFIPTIIKPYDYKILNIFDGLILQLVVLATLILLADNVSPQLSTATIIILITLPLIFFIALQLVAHKETIKTVTRNMTANFKTEPVATMNDNNEVPMSDIGIIIDDNMRKNATICEM